MKNKMIILIVSIFLQIWITSGSGCGDAPNVTLNCEDDGFAHVNWTLSDPHCHSACKAKWICIDAINASNIHENESGFFCRTGWTFDTTWDYYSCNVSVYYEYFDTTTHGNAVSPTTIKRCEKFKLPTITLNCSTNYVTARRSINATWRLPSNISTDRYNPIPDCFISITCGNGYTDRNSTCSKTYGWRFSNIPLIEQSCNVTIAYDYSEDFQSLLYSGSANCSFPRIESKIQSITENPFVGYFYEIQCIVEEHINFGSINWIGPDGAAIVNDSRINIINTIAGNKHTSILQFAYLKETDNGSYNCNVAIQNNTFSTESFMLKDFKRPGITGVRLTAIGSQNVGDKLSLRCDVNITEGIAINIYIQWKINNTVEKDYSLHSMTSVTEFLNLTSLQISDNNTIYQCLAMINTQQNQTISTDFDEFRLIANKSTPSTRSTSNTSTSDNNIATIISSIIAMIIAIGIIIGFIIHCSGKRYFKFTTSHPHNEDQMPMPPVPIDDNYTIPYGPEASTIDYEYLKNNDKENKRMKNDLDISTVDEELSSICSPSLTNEKMLDYVMHGSSMKQHAMPMHDIGYCYSTEDHSKNVKTKNDNGYHSGSNESISHENGSYISESAAFHNDGTKETLFSIQEEIPYFNSAAMIEDEELVRSASSEMINSHTTIESHYQKHVQDAIMTGSTKQESYGTKSDQHSSSSFQTSAEEINEDEKSAVKSPVLSEGGYVPYATAKIQLTSSPTLVEDKHWNGDSFIMSENFPCPSTINQHNPTAVEIVSENSHNNSE